MFTSRRSRRSVAFRPAVDTLPDRVLLTAYIDEPAILDPIYTPMPPTEEEIAEAEELLNEVGEIEASDI